MQFLASEDAFVFTKVVCTDASTAGLTSWTAARRGAKPAGGSGAKKNPVTFKLKASVIHFCI